MTTDLAPQAEKLTTDCRTIFGDPNTWITADGYPESLALCIIDSIFSTGSHYTSVVNVVNAYRGYRQAQGGDADRDGIEELLKTFADVGGSAAGWADTVVDNRKPANTQPGAMLKAEVVHRAAKALDDLEIATVSELRELHRKDEHVTLVKNVWLKLPSQRSGVTFNYLLILAGLPSVKPDRMVIRFVEEMTGLKGLTPSATADLIKEVARLYPADTGRLDHVIWRYASRREFLRADPSDVGTVA